ncbi:MAG TPA: nuclear transport factor 2 family protein [Solirubrobacterales bacterium]
MSEEENVEIVRSIHRAWEKGDFSSADWADPDIEYSPPHERRLSRGVTEMGRRFGEWIAAWENLRVSAEKIVGADDRVVVLNRFQGRGKESGTPTVDFSGASFFTLREGKVVMLEFFWDHQEALEAAGLEE